MLISIIARAAGAEDHPPLLLVGLAEQVDGSGHAFHFQCDLRMNGYEEDSNWPEGESYCVSTEGGFTRFGCVSEIEHRDGAIRVAFTEGAVRDLRLAGSEYEFQVVSDEINIEEILRQLRKILSCGRPEHYPRFLGAWPEDL